MSSAKSESLTSFWMIWMPFISWCCLIAKAKTSNTMLNNRGESGHPCLVPDLGGKALFFPIEDISGGSFIHSFYDLKVWSFYPYFLKRFYQERMLYLSNVFSESIERMMLVLGRSHMAFMILRYAPSVPTFLRVFIKKWCCILSNALSASTERIVWFLSFLLLMWWNTMIVLWIWNQPCISGISPTWSWWRILLMYGWIQQASVLLRILASMFIRVTGL